MVVGVLLEQESRISAVDESVYPLIQDLKTEQTIYIGRGPSGSELEEGVIVSAGHTCLTYMPVEREEDDRVKPGQVIFDDQINSGNVRVSVDPNLFTPEDLTRVPVATKRDVKIARQYETAVANIARMGVNENLLIITPSKGKRTEAPRFAA